MSPGRNAAVVRGGRRGQRDVDVAERFVRRDAAPRAEIARELAGVVAPACRRRTRRARGTTWNVQSSLPVRASKPRTSSGGLPFHCCAAVARAIEVAGDDDDVADDDRAGAPAEAARALGHQAHAAAVPNAASAAAAQVDGVEVAVADVEQPVIRSALPEVDASRARRAGLVRHVGGRFLPPDGLAGGGIERLEQPDGVRRVEDAADHRRRRAQVVVRPQLGELLLQLRVERRAAPEDPEVLDVVAGDLRERRIAGVGGVAARRSPLAVLRFVLRQRQQPAGDRDRDEEDHAATFPHRHAIGLVLLSRLTSFPSAGDLKQKIRRSEGQEACLKLLISAHVSVNEIRRRRCRRAA